MTPMLDAWAAVMGVSGPPGITASAGLTASGMDAAEEGFRVVATPAMRSLEDGVPDAADVLELMGLLAMPEVLELFEGMEEVAQPVSQAVTTTKKSDVMFMWGNWGPRDGAAVKLGLTRIGPVRSAAGIIGQASSVSKATVLGLARKIACHWQRQEWGSKA